MIFLSPLVWLVAAGTSFTCTPTAVWDGDGPILCAEGPKIRLHGIAAREVKRVAGQIVDGGCSRGHPCPNVSGVVARDKLVALLGGAKGALRTGHVRVRSRILSCISYGSAKGGRTDASCSGPRTGDLSCAMVRSGTALRWRAYGGDAVCR
ncbi:hypothetical protein OKW87_08520 [Sphingomonas sp. M1-B02]|nr:hypothetical protein [Sphingomonas sp. S6-11]UZK67937.1 hypothetical protein OKW87_08520 [Sphingomonas sp. S6-11]